MFFKFNTHQIFLQKIPQMSFSSMYFITRKNSGPPLAPHASEAVSGSLWLSGQLGPASSSGTPGPSAQFVCCHVGVSLIPTLTDGFGSKSGWKSWLRTFTVSYFARVAAQASSFKENQQRPLSTASLSLVRRPTSQPVPDGTHREPLLSSTLSAHTYNYFLSKQTCRGVDTGKTEKP